MDADKDDWGKVTLLDIFAGRALPEALRATPDWPNRTEQAATDAYRVALAMLRQRRKVLDRLAEAAERSQEGAVQTAWGDVPLADPPDPPEKGVA